MIGDVELILTDIGTGKRYRLVLSQPSATVMEITVPDGNEEPMVLCVHDGVLQLQPDPSSQIIDLSDLTEEVSDE